jgi:hypothetical protein
VPKTFVCHAPGIDPSALLQILGADTKLATPDELESADRESSRVVLILTSPMESARRTLASAGWSMPRALASYERLVRTTLQAMAGLPAVVAEEGVSSEQLLSSLEGLSSLGGESGISSSSPTPGATASDVPPEIDALWSLARSTIGSHQRFSPPALGAESAWTAELLRLVEELGEVGDALLFATEQLATAMQSDATERFESSLRRREGEEDQFHEPGEGEPYRLNASEDLEAYHEWLTRHRLPTVIGGIESIARTRATTRRRGGGVPLLSVVVPVYRTPIWALRRCVGSVLAQTFAEWELCLVDDASGDAELSATLRSLAKLDRRITRCSRSPSNGGISAATNRAVSATLASFIAFLDHDDELAPHALQAVAASIAANPEADLFYSDEDKIDAAGERFDPLFKPEWSPDLLLSFAYTGHLMVVRRSRFDEVGGLRSDYDGSQDFDLALRASEHARAVVAHPGGALSLAIDPRLGGLRHDLTTGQAVGLRSRPTSDRRCARRRSEPGEVTTIPEFPGRYHVRRRRARPSLSSASSSRFEMSRRCSRPARTLRADPGYDNFELVLVDNDSACQRPARSSPNSVPNPASECSGTRSLQLGGDQQCGRPGLLRRDPAVLEQRHRGARRRDGSTRWSGTCNAPR